MIGNIKKPNQIDYFKCGDTFDYDYKKIYQVGTTYRMTTPQAAVGIEQLKKLSNLNAKRSRIARQFNKEIKKLEMFEILPINKKVRHSYYIYTFFLNPEKSRISRDKILEILEKKYSIKILLRYWPLHLNGIFRFKGFKLGDCPIFEKIWFKKQINLPVEPSLKKKEIRHIISSLQKINKTYLKK